jgi:hypothetical protein
MEPKHANSNLANCELLWCGTDTEELYQKNKIENAEKLKQHGWNDCPITYKFNHFGFRADEFTTEPAIMFVGCSHTFGVGLPVESTWAHQVSTALKLKNFNLGVGGASNDTAFRLANYWIVQLKPTVVVFLSTERTRSELHTINNDIEDLSAHRISENQFPDATSYMRHWFGNDTNSDMNYLKNTLAIKQLCNERDIKYFHYEALNIHEADKARDLQHYGILTNKQIAKYILNKL